MCPSRDCAGSASSPAPRLAACLPSLRPAGVDAIVSRAPGRHGHGAAGTRPMMDGPGQLGCPLLPSASHIVTTWLVPQAAIMVRADRLIDA